MPRRLPLSRRTFLRGAGAAIALPMLDAMRPARAASATAKPPVRAAFLYFPNGAWLDGWVPKADGPGYELPFSLAPLEPLKSEVLVLSGLDKKQSIGGDGHYAKTANFLTGLTVTKTTGKNISVGGASVDQYLAAKVGHQTPLPSLELGTDPVVSGIDSNVGYTRLYGSNISWRDARTPVAKEISPRLAYQRLFGPKGERRGSTPPSSAASDDANLLDLALEDAKGLRRKLGRDDQVKLDEYLDSVRAVERRIAFAATPQERRWVPVSSVAPIPVAEPETGLPKDFRDHVRLMLDLMVLAFWSDSTRVISFMFANDVSGRNFSFLDGVRTSHHETSHHQKQAGKIDQYQRIVRWHVGQFAYLCDQLRRVPEGESGTLLDNALVVCGSSFSDGDRHDPLNLPILLGGRGGKTLTPGRHIASPKATPLCNLYAAVLNRTGAPVQGFGDSTAALDIG